MSKFLLNLLLQISKAFVYSKIQFLFEKNFFPQNSAHPAQPRPCWPAPHRRPPHVRARPIPACAALAYLPKVVSSSNLRSSATTTSSSVTTTWAPPICFVVSPRRPTRSTPPPRLTAIDHPAPPGLHHCDANKSPLLNRLDSPS
jgi:hypothetical protein